MAVCTNTEVFDFMGTPTEQRTTHGAAVTSLITRATEQFKQVTGRSPELIDQSSIAKVFSNNVNCQIFDQNLYLSGLWRDWYDITEVKEDGILLGEIVSSATQNNDYVIDSVAGKINRPWAAWLHIPGCIEIKGHFGLVTRAGAGTVNDPYTYPTRDDVKQIIIEMAAALTGLWKQTVMTEAGQVDTTRIKITPETQKALDGYKLRYV